MGYIHCSYFLIENFNCIEISLFSRYKIEGIYVNRKQINVSILTAGIGICSYTTEVCRCM